MIHNLHTPEYQGDNKSAKANIIAQVVPCIMFSGWHNIKYACFITVMMTVIVMVID